MLTVLSTLQVGSTWASYFAVLLANVVFFSAQWEQYYSGILELGYINVTEAQFMVMFIHGFTAYKGPGIWLQQYSAFGYTLPLNLWLLVFQSVSIIGTMLKNFWTVNVSIINKKLNAIEVYSNFLPCLFGTVFSALWGYFSPSHILQTHSHIFLLAIGFLFANMVGRIVFARMCLEQISWFSFLIVPFILGFGNAYFKNPSTGSIIMPESTMVWLAFGVCFGGYMHFALSIIDILTKKLNIHCLSIPPPKSNQ